MESSDKNGPIEGNRGAKCLLLGSLQAFRVVAEIRNQSPSTLCVVNSFSDSFSKSVRLRYLVDTYLSPFPREGQEDLKVESLRAH